MSTKGVIHRLLSSHLLRRGAFWFFILASVQFGAYFIHGTWLNLTPLWWLPLLFLVGAVLAMVFELWLRTDSAKAVMAPFATRFQRSRIWRELNKPVIANSVTVTIIVTIFMMAAMMAVMWAAIQCVIEGFSYRALEGFLAGWPFLAIIAGMGALLLIFYHAGIDSERAFNKLFFGGFIGAIGFVAGMVYPQLGSQLSRDAQHGFHKAILSEPAPCVTIQDKLSDLSVCAVFGLRPGMTQSEALNIVNGSGYFRDKEKPSVCKTAENCSRSVYFLKDGLYLEVQFKSAPKFASPELRVSSIVLSLDEGANPYFDENQMMAKFLKLVGPNGTSIETFTVWIDIKNDMELRAYTYERKFWAVFSRLADRPSAPGSGVPV